MLGEGQQEDLWKSAAQAGECKTGLVGLALSGGGIRSSTFSLGVLQALDRIGLFKHVDYLSTVSGGGYIGTYLSTCILQDLEGTREPRSQTTDEDQPVFPFSQKTGVTESDRLRHLRNYASFLTPRGKSDLLAIPIVLLRGIVVNLMFILPLLAFLALVLALTLTQEHTFVWTAGLQARGVPQVVATFPFSLVAGGVLLSWMLLYPLGHFYNELGSRARRRRESKERRRRYRFQRMQGWVLVAGVALLFIELQPWALDVLGTGTWSDVEPMVRAGLGGGLAGGVLFADKLASQIEKMWGKLSLLLIGGASAAMLWLMLLWMTDRFLQMENPLLWPPWGYLAAVVLVLYCLILVDVNFTSLHKLYRDRLVSAFVAQADPVDPHHEVPKLSELNTGRAPYHLINAAVNVERAEEQFRFRSGRKAGFFFFGKRYCGGVRTGYLETTELEKVAHHLDVGTAMAISGAAVAPRMGKATNRVLTFIMALLNVRLNYWLPNPSKLLSTPDDRWTRLQRQRLRFVKPGPVYLLREMFAGVSVKHSYVNLSDGGHVENLGVYELLRRQCRLIIASDGECDPDLSCGGLSEVIRMARIDFGFQVEMDGIDEIRSGQQQYAIGRIRYGDERMGVLLYLKSNLGGDYNLEATLAEERYRTSPERDDDRLFDENAYVAHYRQLHPDFPHETTVDQLFDEFQFESYRALGCQVASAALIAPWKSPGLDQSEEEESA